MNNTSNVNSGTQKSAPAKAAIQQKPSLLARLKKKLWGKKKKKDLEIYPLF